MGTGWQANSTPGTAHMDPASELRLALRAAGFPAIGVTMRDPTDWRTWQVQYVLPLDEAQQVAVRAFFLTYDPVAEAERVDDRETLRALTNDRIVGALMRWVAQRLQIPVPQALAEIQRLARRPRGQP